MKGDVSRVSRAAIIPFPAQMMQSIGTCACFSMQAESTADVTEAQWQSAPNGKCAGPQMWSCQRHVQGPDLLNRSIFSVFLQLLSSNNSDDFVILFFRSELEKTNGCQRSVAWVAWSGRSESISTMSQHQVYTECWVYLRAAAARPQKPKFGRCQTQF